MFSFHYSVSNLKEWLTQKLKLAKMCSLSGQQDVEEFVSSSDLEKCIIISLTHQWMLCSEWVPSE